MVLKKLGAPVMTNLYYNTIKILLERTSSVLIDKDAITVRLFRVSGVLFKKIVKFLSMGF